MKTLDEILMFFDIRIKIDRFSLIKIRNKSTLLILISLGNKDFSPEYFYTFECSYLLFIENATSLEKLKLNQIHHKTFLYHFLYILEKYFPFCNFAIDSGSKHILAENSFYQITNTDIDIILF